MQNQDIILKRQEIEKARDVTSEEIRNSEITLRESKEKIRALSRKIDHFQSSVERNESIVESRRTRCDTEPRNAAIGGTARHLTIGGGTLATVALISNPVGKKCLLQYNKGSNPHHDH